MGVIYNGLKQNTIKYEKFKALFEYNDSEINNGE